MASVYVFWDNSNIFISAQSIARERDGINSQLALRLQFSNLMKLATCNRSLKKAIAVGSIPPEQEEMWKKMNQETGLSIELYERGELSRREQGVDQCLQTHILRALADESEPQIAVLLTGDGAGAVDGVGFLSDIKRLHTKGWGVEVLSWEHSCNKDLKKWAEDNGIFVKLDDFYDSITFISGGRRSIPLSLTRRRVSSPCKIIDYEKEELRAKLAEYEQKENNKKKYGKKVAQRKRK